MSEHDKTMPWQDKEYIVLRNGRGVKWKLCYKATKDQRIFAIALPGCRAFNMPNFVAWANNNGWRVDFPLSVHVDVA